MIQSAMKTLTTLYLLVLSADNFCKQFGSRSGLTKRRAWFGSKLFDRWYSLQILSKKLILKKAADDKKTCKNFPAGKDLSRKDTDHQPVHHLHNRSQLHHQPMQHLYSMIQLLCQAAQTSYTSLTFLNKASVFLFMHVGNLDSYDPQL